MFLGGFIMEHNHEHHHEHNHEHTHSSACHCGHSHSDAAHTHTHSHGECCHHDHSQNGRIIYIRLGIGLVLALLVLLLRLPSYLSLIPYVILGYDVLYSSVKNILHGEFFDEEFLMSIATLGSIALGEYTEACAVMFFYQAGELLSDITADKCRTSIKNMYDFAPDFARRITDSGFETVAPASLRPGDRIAVFAGEKIPCDGVVFSGDSYADTSSMTGEGMPVHVSDGSKVLGGTINLDSPINVRITDEYKASSVAKVVRMLEEASENKAKTEKFITAFAKKYTPAVVLIALLSACILPLLPGFDIHSGIYTALTFLVISCPCALVISIPLTLFSGIGRASKNKILFKGNSSLEKLRKIKNFAFDKTGTLTNGRFEIESTTLSSEDFTLLAHAERFSNHPLSAVIASCAEKPYKTVSGLTEFKGMGISGELDGIKLLAGNEKLMAMHNIKNVPPICATAVHFAADGVYRGYVLLSDKLKESSAAVLAKLKESGAALTILSGDAEDAVKNAAEAVGADRYYARLLPEDKLSLAKELSKNGALAYVGDGINDAPVLAAADIGISMGGAGSDIAIANSDIILLDDDLASLNTAIKISRKTMRIVYQNIVLSLGIKAAVMLLGFFKLSSMPLAIFADVGVMMISVLNSMRAMR